jgi:hypothetical protein
MKTNFLHLSILLFCLASLNNISAQFIITSDNFPRQATFADTFHVAIPPVINYPSTGPDQTWDYSDLISDEVFVTNYFSAENDDDFPGAFNFYERNLVFQVFDLPSNQYDGLDENGWFDLGRDMADVTYPISFITGGPNDKLRFVGNKTLFDGRLDNIQFPATYGDSWTQSRREVSPFELTVAAFGLNAVPGVNVRIAAHTREIIAYGKLIMPAADGSPSEPIDVLLFDVKRTFADSVYLGGAPAPQLLMDAFGLSQGQGSSDHALVFYRADFGSPVMNFVVGSEFVAYRPQAVFGTSRVDEPVFSVLNSYPNPVSPGQILTIETGEILSSGKLIIYDGSGKIVLSRDFNTAGQNGIQVQIPQQCVDGLHFFTISDKQNRPTAKGKVMIKN